ncbi:MAG: hypothetical protein ACI9CO_000509 [Candidatus Azotimanducaceae bacterium]|jgi:hypothetical protein
MDILLKQGKMKITLTSILNIYGYFPQGVSVNPALLTHSSPFSDVVFYAKHYSNFYYKLVDLTNDEFERNKYVFEISNRNGQSSGFKFESPKTGGYNAGEVIDGSVTRQVRLPKSYFDKANAIQSEVKQAGQKAIDAQKQAIVVKNQYTKRICKKSVTVSFIDNEEYKNICKDSEYHAILKEKMNTKLAQVDRLKKQKREQLNQQQLINAQTSQANAAQRQANEAEYANIM